MARDPTLLSSQDPIAFAPANPTISHVQLRDLLICPREQGLVNYIAQKAIIEQDLHAPGAPTRVLAQLNFTPNSLTALPIGQNDTLVAAGGQDTEIHLSYHTPSSTPRSTRLQWEFEDHLTGSINNSVLLTSLSLTGSNESSVEPRVGISNNDGTVRLYDVPMRVHNSRRKLADVGVVSLDIPINHSSISPDGRTLISVGDSNKVFFHRITGGAQISFTPITTLIIPAADVSPHLGFPTTSLAASFSTAFSGDGSKFAVASQEGVVAVWDVRSTKVMKVFQTDKTRGLGGGLERVAVSNGSASGWLSDDPWEWTRGNKAPGWCVRSVKFNSGEGARLGKEVMAFTEHTSIVHIVDARTFETHDTIRVPTVQRPQPRPRPRLSSAPSRVVSPSSTPSPPASAPSASAPSSSSAAQQRRLQRNLARRIMPVSNARRTAPISVAPSSSSRRPPPPAGSGNGRIARPAPPPSSAPSSPSRPGIVQAIGDAFRIPASAYSAPASIGDSTWRTLSGRAGTSGTPPIILPPRAPNAARVVRSAGLSAPMPSLAEWASYVLDREEGPATSSLHHDDVRDLREDMQEDMREDEGALARRIRREERALSRGMHFGTGLFEDDGESSSSETEFAAIGLTHISPMTTEAYLGGWQEDEERQLLLDQEESRDQDQDGIVVVPDLGDRDVESEVHALLAVHGIQSRLGGHGHGRSEDDVDLDEGFDEEYDPGRDTDRDTNTGSTHGDYEYPLHRRRSRRSALQMHHLHPGALDEADEDAGLEADRMEVDGEGDVGAVHEPVVDVEGEEDADCVSTANSRSASPTLDSGSASGSMTISTGDAEQTTSSPSISSTRYGSASRSTLDSKSDDFDCDSDDDESGGAYYSGNSYQQNGTGSKPHYLYYDDLDIAGLCFDPWGERMYVAGAGTNLSPGSPSIASGGLFTGAFGHGASSTAVENLGAVVEWGVRGAEKRWWVDDGWM